MKTYLANTAHDVLGYDLHSIASVPGGFIAARAHYAITVFPPHLSLVNWRHSGIVESRCLICTAIPCQIQEGLQS